MRIVCKVEQDDRQEEPPAFRIDLEDDAVVDVIVAVDVAGVPVEHLVVLVDDKLDAVLLGHDGVGHADLSLQLLLMSGP